MKPSELLQSELWWKGPSWLQQPMHLWPSEKQSASEPVECYLAVAADEDQLEHAAVEEVADGDLLLRYSNLSTLLRVVALCLRWRKLKSRDRGFIWSKELTDALDRIITLSQCRYFSLEIEQLKQGKTVSKRSPLLSLRPFLDDRGLLRVGGRLQAAALTYDQRHPLLIHKKCNLAVLLMRDVHVRTLHGGPQLTRNLIAQRFWIIKGNSLVRQLVRSCVRCARFSGGTGQQVMGSLPADRVNIAHPFLHSGVDYAGPFTLKTKRGRGFTSYKGFIALFVCLATKAVHLEVVTGLTSEAFIAAFQRFVGRRGNCARLYSDNGTTFRGADKELRAMFKAATQFYKDAAMILAEARTSWEFIPPYATSHRGATTDV